MTYARHLGWLLLAAVLYGLGLLATLAAERLLDAASRADERADTINPLFCHDGIVGRERRP